MRSAFLFSLALAGFLLAGCTYEQNRSPEAHFAAFKTVPPNGNVITICHAYGCKISTKVHLSAKDVADVKKLMDASRKDDSAAEERRAIAYAVGWLETRIGNEIGTSADRAGMELAGPGDPTQMDCVDEATNTTAYMLFLQNNGFLKHHTVGTPFAKDNLIKGIAGWTHWTAVLKENPAGQKWAVDSWIYANGENPAVVEAEHWYIDDLASLPKPTH